MYLSVHVVFLFCYDILGQGSMLSYAGSLYRIPLTYGIAYAPQGIPQ